MKYSNLTQRIASEGAAAWDIHYEAQALKAAGEDVIILSVGDPDLSTDERVKSAAAKALENDDTHYSDCQGESSLRDALSDWENRRRGNAVDAANIVVQAGAQCGLYSIAQCLFEAGDEVIIPEPMYITYEAAFTASGATIVNTPMDSGSNWSLDLAAIDRAINANTRALVLNTPNNPTGAVLTKDEWQHLVSLANSHNLWVIIDEVYSELIFEGEHPIGWLSDELGDRLITINSLSKSHAMTGWRTGWVCCNKVLAEHLTNLALCMHYGLPSFVQTAAITAVKEYDSIVPPMREIYRRRRDAALSVLSERGVNHVATPPAGMFLMLDIRPYMASATEFAQRLLAEHKVSVLVGDTFGAPAEGHVRISFCLKETEIRRAMSRIADFIDGL